MCFFEQDRWACGYWRWGHFRQHCNKEYRVGETCGIKLIYEDKPQPGVCKVCRNVERKRRRYDKMHHNLQRWRREGRRPATVQQTISDMEEIVDQINRLTDEHDQRVAPPGFVSAASSAETAILRAVPPLSISSNVVGVKPYDGKLGSTATDVFQDMPSFIEQRPSRVDTDYLDSATIRTPPFSSHAQPNAVLNSAIKASPGDGINYDPNGTDHGPCPDCKAQDVICEGSKHWSLFLEKLAMVCASPKKEVTSLQYDTKTLVEVQGQFPSNLDDSSSLTQSPTVSNHLRRPANKLTNLASSTCGSGEVSPSEPQSDDSSEESILSITTVAESRKEVVIRYIINQCRSHLNKKLVLLAYQWADGGGSPSLFEQPNTSAGSISESKRARLSGGGVADWRPDDNNDDDEDGDKADPSAIVSADSNLYSPKLACPFLKHNRIKYSSWRCCRSGWGAVHRLKEHIYRRHRLPRFKCGRCCQDLKTSTELLNHQRADEPCERREEEYQDGINESQYQALRSRKRPRGILSEKEKWEDVYRIIFPYEDLVPSPYDEFTMESGFNLPADNSSHIVRELGCHVRRELPRLMRPRLNEMLDQVISESITTETIVTIAQGVFQQLIESFPGPRPGGQPTTTNSTLATRTAPDDSIPVTDSPTVQRSENTIIPGSPTGTIPACNTDIMAPSTAENYSEQALLDLIFHDIVIDSFGSHSIDFDPTHIASLQSSGDSAYGSLGDTTIENPDGDISKQ